MTLRRTVAATLILASCASPKPSVDLAITNVAVVDVATGEISRDQNVLVSNGVIESVDAKSTTGAARIIDGAGKFLIPGLSDMHVHLRREDQLPLYVANGVTLVRDMWGDDDTLVLRDEIAAGERFGPTVIAGSPGLDGAPPTFPNGPSAATPDAARAFVRDARSRGYDFIKIYDRLTTEVLDAVSDETRIVGLPFAGHAPFDVPFDHVLNSGVASLEHGQGFFFNYLDDSVQMPEGPFNPNTHFGALMGAAVGVVSRGGDISELFDPEERVALAEKTAAAGVWSTPTLVALIKTNTPSGEREAALSKPEMRYLNPDQIAAWGPDRNFRFQFLGDSQLNMLRLFAAEIGRLTDDLDKAGAGILAGTDAPEAFVAPGFALHEELRLLVAAGLTPRAALAAATTGPAEFLDLQGVRGCIEPGCAADLVLLDANPLDNIENTRTISGVVLQGEWHSKNDLDQRLELLATSFEK